MLDDNTLTVFKGTKSGSIITIDEYAPGYTDVGHAVGQVVVLKPSTLWADIVRAYLDDLTAFTTASTQVTQVRNETPGGPVNGINVTFSLVGSAVTGSVELYKNGVRQKPGAGNDYTVSGTVITMALAPLTGAILLADYATSTSLFTAPTTVGIRTNEAVSGTVNGTNKVFTTIAAYVPGTLEVWVNGLKQTPVTHYVETTPTSGIFTFDDAPLTGDNIMVNYQNSLSFAIGDADTVDTFHASPVASANSILPLNASAKYPVTVVEGLNTPDSGWVAPTLLNSWTTYDANFNTAGYRKDSEGWVHLKGMIKDGTGIMFTLPLGYRPKVDGARRYLIACHASGGIGRIDLFSNGDVQYISGGTAWFSLDNVHFKAEV
jgi:hypothetical protein